MRRKAEEVKLKQAANWDVPNIGICHQVDILDVGIDVDIEHLEFNSRRLKMHVLHDFLTIPKVCPFKVTA